MSDWPSFAPYPNSVVINSLVSPTSSGADAQAFHAAATTASQAWTTANLAMYIPFVVNEVMTAYQMAVENLATIAGNVDVGIYDESLNRLVSSGSTAQSGASVLQVFNIADTVLTPGGYFMALNSDSTTATFGGSSSLTTQLLQISGVQEQAVGAVTLPDPAVFANPSRAWIPNLSVVCVSTAL